MSQLGGPGEVGVQRTWYEVSGVAQAKLVEQLVDMTKEVLMDGKNGCAKAIRVGRQLGGRVKTGGKTV